jgi:DNA polymerase II large subunit
MKDIKGNLRKFSMQTFRCTNCNTKYRRPPLIGKCTKCGNASINFTIHEGSIKKYLIPSFNIVNNYNVDPYIVETLELANLRVEGVFGKESEHQKSLSDFFGNKK